MNYTEQQLTAAVVSEGLRPVLAGPQSGASPTLLSLIKRCWDADPQNRPSFSDIVLELDVMSRSEHRTDEKADTSARSVTPRDHVDTTNSLSYQEALNWFSQGQDIEKSSYVPSESVAAWLSTDDVTVYCPVLSWGSFSTCGRRETMEDTHFILPRFCNENSIHFFGIFDGHRGMWNWNPFSGIIALAVNYQL